MSFKWIGSAFLCSAMAFACGGGGSGGSGVDGDVVLLDITAGEAGDVCDYIVNLGGPEREIDCGDGTTVTVGNDPSEVAGDIADCTADLQAVPDDCDATVGELESCFEAFADASDAELCDEDAPLPPECTPIIPCLGG
jgi:hypothetical protein